MRQITGASCNISDSDLGVAQSKKSQGYAVCNLWFHIGAGLAHFSVFFHIGAKFGTFFVPRPNGFPIFPQGVLSLKDFLGQI